MILVAVKSPDLAFSKKVFDWPACLNGTGECDGAKFFKAAADLGLEGIVSKRAASLYRTGRSKNWLKTKNMVEVNSSF